MATETKPEVVHSATTVQRFLAQMAFERMDVKPGPFATENFLIEHIANMLAILGSPSAYEELWRRVREGNMREVCPQCGFVMWSGRPSNSL